MRVTAITGRVLATRRTTTVSGGGSVSGSASSGTVSGSSYVSTSVHDNFRLKGVDGRQHDVELKDFQARVFEGDVVTVGYATRRGDSRPFVVLNHTTGVSDTNAVTIRQLSSPGDLRLIAQIFVGIFTIIGIPLLIAYVVFERRQRRHFMDTGLLPLWAATAPAAAQLPAGA